jgi:gluconolactonase
MTEGPLWTASGRLLVTSVNRGLVYEVPLDGGQATVAFETGGTPEALAEDADGHIWVTQAQGPSHPTPGEPPSIQKWDACTGIVARVTGSGLDAPNDLCLGPDGRIWFTDPAGPPFVPDGMTGRVLALDPDTGALETLGSGLRFPNGLALGPSGDQLFVAETNAHQVVVMAWDGKELGQPKRFAALPVGSPDGMAFDISGYLHVAAPDADRIWVFAPDGRVDEEIELGPSFPTNVAFVGPELSGLAVAVVKGGRVLMLERRRPGLALAAGGATIAPEGRRT